MKKTTLCATLFACGLMLIASSAFAQSIAFIDLEKAVMEVAEGKGAIEKLKKFHADKQVMLDKEMEALKKEKDDLDKKAAMMTAEARTKKEAEFGARVNEFQGKGMALQQELDQMKQQALEPIMDKMSAIVQTLAEKDGYTAVLNKAAVVYASEKYDITSQVVREYDKKYAAAAAPAAPASTAPKAPAPVKAKGK